MYKWVYYYMFKHLLLTYLYKMTWQHVTSLNFMLSLQFFMDKLVRNDFVCSFIPEIICNKSSTKSLQIQDNNNSFQDKSKNPRIYIKTR